MKKAKFVLLTALVLSAIMLLSSCIGATKALSVADIIDAEAEYENDYSSIGSSVLLSELTDTTLYSSKEDLYYFTGYSTVDTTSYKKHVVYNAKTGNVVYNATESITENYSIDIGSISECEDAGYFTVTVEKWTLDASNVRLNVESKKVTLYDANGNIVDYANSGSPSVVYDLLYFNGKCYRVNDSGAFEYAFDYSPLAKFPNIDVKNDNYYYDYSDSQGDSYILVYNKSLELVTSYRLPIFAMGASFIVLDNGDIFIQYLRSEEENAKDYTFFVSSNGYYGASSLKYTLFTEIFSIEKGEAKEIDCDYVVDYGYATKDVEENNLGLNAEKIPVIAAAAPIVEKHVAVSNDSYRLITIDTKGKITEIDSVNGSFVSEISLVRDGYWVIRTDIGNSYLMNKDGEILGDITNASTFGDYLYANGKIFNYDLEPVYDYIANGYSLKKAMPNALLLTDNAGDLYIYNNSSSVPVCVMDKELGYALQMTGENYFVIRNSTGLLNIKYDLYNENGAHILTVDNNSYLASYYFEEEAYSNGTVLVKTKNAENQNVYYALS